MFLPRFNTSVVLHVQQNKAITNDLPLFYFLALLLLLLSRFSRVRLCVTPQTAARQAPPSLGFSRQEYSCFVLFFFVFQAPIIKKIHMVTLTLQMLRVFLPLPMSFILLHILFQYQYILQNFILCLNQKSPFPLQYFINIPRKSMLSCFIHSSITKIVHVSYIQKALPLCLSLLHNCDILDGKDMSFYL